MRGLGPDVLSVVGSTGFNCWISFTPSSHYLCFISFLYLDSYLLGDDTSISKGSLMLTKYLFVLIHIKKKGEVGTVKLV